MSAARVRVLAAYPPWFRDRYGDELAVLSGDHGPSGWATADLAVGALRAWARPAFAGSPLEVRRSRLLASVSTVWVCWCVVVVGTIATLRLLEDPAAPGLDVRTPGWVLAGHITTAAIALAALLITAAGAVPGWRAMRRSPVVRRLMAGPMAVLLLVVAGFVPIAVVALRTPAVHDTKHFSPLFAVGLVAWTLLVAVTSIWWTIAVPRALRAARPRVDTLRVPGVVAVVVAVLLLAPTTLLTAVAIATGTAWGLAATIICMSCTLVVIAAAVVGLVSAGRSLTVLTSPSPRS